jgi:hypothetical protein
VLERAGLIERGRDGQARPSRLLTQALDDAVRWMETRKRTWEARMDRLDAYLQQQRTYPLRYEIVELVEPELIVLRCPPMPELGLPDGTVTRVEFHDRGDKTRMTLTDGPYPRDGGGHAEAGWNGAFDKLAVLLEH